MPDTNQNSNVVSRAAQSAAADAAAEAAAERDIAGIRNHDDSFITNELRLQSTREPLSPHQQAVRRQAAEEGVEIENGEIRLRSIRDEVVPSQPTPAISPKPGAAPTQPETNKTSEAVPAPNSSHGAAAVEVPAAQAVADKSNAAASGSGSVFAEPSPDKPPVDTNTAKVLPPQSALPGAGLVSPGSAPDASAGSGPLQPGSGGDFSPAVMAQTQSLQTAGDGLRAALEQNALITNSLFNRTLELLDLQNRRLGDVDRRINEIHGQMKSLKNP